MKAHPRPKTIRALFLDVGGVLLSNGWDRYARKRAVKEYGLEPAEFESRHRLNFETYEEGKITLDEYLARVVFHQKRPFSRVEFRQFIFAQTKPHPEMIDLFIGLKKRYALKIAVVNNEGRELNAYRIQKFKLAGFVDFFISSCFVRTRKPDLDIFRLALDAAQIPASQVVYIDDTPMFIDLAQGLGIRGIAHQDYLSTCAKLRSLGLEAD